MKSKFKQIFSPFIWKSTVNEHNEIKDYIMPIIDDYQTNTVNSPDWPVDTSYESGYDIDWWPCIQHYKTYVNDFHTEYFGYNPNWEIIGQPWYTSYKREQMAQIHEHIPDHFSVLHILKFSDLHHQPIVFINPEEKLIKSNYIRGEFQETLKKSESHRGTDGYFNLWHYTDIIESNILIWPSTLQHFVPKSTSDERRITIAFNYNITES